MSELQHILNRSFYSWTTRAGLWKHVRKRPWLIHSSYNTTQYNMQEGWVTHEQKGVKHILKPSDVTRHCHVGFSQFDGCIYYLFFFSGENFLRLLRALSFASAVTMVTLVWHNISWELAFLFNRTTECPFEHSYTWIYTHMTEHKYVCVKT